MKVSTSSVADAVTGGRAGALDLIQLGIQAMTQSFTRPRMHERLLSEAGVRADRASIIILFKLGHGLDNVGTMRITDIAALVGVDTPAVTRKIQQLEHQGLVSRCVDPSDRRSVRIALTSAGREVLEQVMRAHRALLDRLFAQWSQAELAEFASHLTRLTDSLTTEVESYRD